MIIPCIDIKGGRAVQLIQGQKQALDTSVEDALALFEGFPLIHVIDLDEALGTGSNLEVVKGVLSQRRARVGGGVRSLERAQELLDAGAEQVIVGSAAFRPETFLPSLARYIDPIRIIVAIDCKGGQIAIDGWRTQTSLDPRDAIAQFEPYCGGFLCTNVDHEGLMQGTDLGFFLALRVETEKTLIAAGGITTLEEAEVLTSAGIEVALGMAVYTGRLSVSDLRQML